MAAIYLDNNATTPLAPEVISAIRQACEEAWANPSSGYKRGCEAKSILEAARKHMAALVDQDPELAGDVITFTSGGTEANHTVMHWAIETFKSKYPNQVPHIITTNIEHCATELPLKAWQKEGRIKVTFVPVEHGLVHEEDIKNAIQESTCLVTVMLANNETGVIQPLKNIIQVVKCVNESRRRNNQFEILTHTDAAQAFGKIPVSVKEFPVDYITIVGHKMYGPRIGAIYHAPGNPCKPPLFIGGGQERNRRSGTENTPMAVGLGEAARLIKELGSKAFGDLEYKRNLLIQLLKEDCPPNSINVNFGDQIRLPNTASLCFTQVDAGILLEKCNGKIEASRSAACHTGNEAASSVLIKSGLTFEEAASTLRLSIGRYTTLQDIKEAARVLSDAYLDCLKL